MFTNFPLFPQQASVQASQVDGIYFFMLAVTAFFSLLIAGLVVFFAVKFRRRHEDEVGVPIHGSLALELLWTIIPFLITMVMFGWGAKVFFELYRAPAGAMEVYVVGKQWMWKVQHMDGQREINELHVPLGRPVKLVMGSEDVLHSYFIPAFRVKADVIPGRYNMLWFTASKPGRYHLFCAEYCGTNHSGMIGTIIAMEPTEFQAWLGGGRPSDTPAAAGEKLFQSQGCVACHRRGRDDSRAVAHERLRVHRDAAGRGHGRRRRGVHPRIDRQSPGEDRRRLPAAHADVPGAGFGRAVDAAHRLHQVAEHARRCARRGSAAGEIDRTMRARGTGFAAERTLWKP